MGGLERDDLVPAASGELRILFPVAELKKSTARPVATATRDEWGMILMARPRPRRRAVRLPRRFRSGPRPRPTPSAAWNTPVAASWTMQRPPRDALATMPRSASTSTATTALSWREPLVGQVVRDDGRRALAPKERSSSADFLRSPLGAEALPEPVVRQSDTVPSSLPTATRLRPPAPGGGSWRRRGGAAPVVHHGLHGWGRPGGVCGRLVRVRRRLVRLRDLHRAKGAVPVSRAQEHVAPAGHRRDAAGARRPVQVQGLRRGGRRLEFEGGGVEAHAARRARGVDGDEGAILRGRQQGHDRAGPGQRQRGPGGSRGRSGGGTSGRVRRVPQLRGALPKVGDLHLHGPPRDGVLDSVHVHGVLVGQVVKHVARLDGVLAALLVAEDQVDPVVEVSGHVVRLERLPVEADELFLAAVGPGGQHDVAEGVARLGHAHVEPVRVGQRLGEVEELGNQLLEVGRVAQAPLPGGRDRVKHAVGLVKVAPLEVPEVRREGLHSRQKVERRPTFE